MDPRSPYYLFHPDSIGWLHRRHERGEEITEADIARLLRADPANATDPILHEYNIRALETGLPKKRGRKPAGTAHRLKVTMAAWDVEERTAEIWKARESGRVVRSPGDPEPCVQAAEEVAREWRLSSGRSLLNEISARKLKQVFQERPPSQ